MATYIFKIICGHIFESVGTDLNLWPHIQTNLWPQIQICGNTLQSVATDSEYFYFSNVPLKSPFFRHEFKQINPGWHQRPDRCCNMASCLRKHEVLNQCWCNARPASQTVANIKPALGYCPVFAVIRLGCALRIWKCRARTPARRNISHRGWAHVAPICSKIWYGWCWIP